ncbi:MAG: glycosyltransferase [Candidatus Komeilibacteria bacterium]|jgi:glycosyltransferase involved in cell wall biosynthesis|nr:glycosyltransferase [Candidatus Komeilibacteria bacterium]MBT4447624.1 glycosyltransferase [Candidatus Komeilibacteria bacterium]
MKVILATPLYPPEIEDISLYCKELTKHLKDDNQFRVLAYANQVESDKDVDVVIIDKHQPLFIRLVKYTWKLFKMSKQADLIYVQNAVAAGLPAIIVKSITKIPVLVNFAEDESWKRSTNLRLSERSLEEFLQDRDANVRNKWIMRLQTWVLRRASKVMVSSKLLADLVADSYKLDPEKVVYNYNPEYRKQNLPFKLAIKKYQVFTSGPLVDWAGMDNIIKAVDIVCDDFPEARLAISGDGPAKDRLIDLAKNLEISDKVDFFGKISKAQNWYLRKTSQVYVHNFEGIDVSGQVTQSFLAGIPVIARDTAINREIFSDCQCGLFVKSLEAKDLAKKIIQIFNNQDLADDLVYKAEQVLENKFSWAAHIDKLNNIFASLIRK